MKNIKQVGGWSRETNRQTDKILELYLMKELRAKDKHCYGHSTEVH